MPGVNPEGREQAVGPLLCVAEKGHIGQADVHGQVAEPGKKKNMGKAELLLSRDRDPVPDLRLGHFPQVIQVGMDAQPGQHGHRARDEDDKDPGRTDLGEPAELFEAQDGHGREGRADGEGQDDPADAVRKDRVEGRDLDPEGETDGGGRHRDHGAGQDAVEKSVGDVVDEGDTGTGDLPQVPVECQPGPDGDGRADEGPGEDGEQVPEDEPQKEVPGADAVEDEEGADDELGGRDVFAGEQAGELAARLELVRGDGHAVELIEFVHLQSQGRKTASHDDASPGRGSAIFFSFDFA